MSSTPQDRLYDELCNVAREYGRELGMPGTATLRLADAMHQAAVYETGQIQEQMARQKVLPL